jgi:hypothetical protein
VSWTSVQMSFSGIFVGEPSWSVGWGGLLLDHLSSICQYI